MKLHCAKRAIEDWKRLESEWHETYADIKARIDARTAAKQQAKPTDPMPCTTPEGGIPIELKETSQMDVGRLLVRLLKDGMLIPEIKTAAAAIKLLGNRVTHDGGEPVDPENVRKGIQKASAKK